MLESDCFLKLNHQCQITELKIDTNLPPSRTVIDVAFGNQKLIEGYENDPLLKAVFNKFAPTWELHALQIHKLPPYTCYDWHADSRNGSSLNCVWDVYDSLTVFYDESTSVRGGLLDIVTLKYEPKQWYAFNSKVPHTVFNFGAQPRYLITASLNSTVSYTTLVEWYNETFKS
jgi:hypothetical protein